MNSDGHPLRLADVLQVTDILLDVDVTHKCQLFDTAASHLSRQVGINPGQISRQLLEREAQGSTGLGLGVAIAHARIPGLETARAAFIRPQFPMPFDATDGKPVYGILVLLVPEQAEAQHLQLLAQAAQIFCSKRFVEMLRTCKDAASVHQLLVQVFKRFIRRERQQRIVSHQSMVLHHAHF